MEQPTVHSSSARAWRLLVVDDDAATLFGFSEYFRARGFVVDAAAALEDAEALLAERRYDAVVSDLRLTGPSLVEGLVVLASAQSARPQPCTVLVSGYLTAETEREASRLGIDRVISKPIPPAALERILLDLFQADM